ncbi:MAG TPA: hypothetical protein VNO14_16370, partial [Blastocatellia bacterium]|nr:hypothetical protein [Blastocatellia bacterium]
MANQALRPSSVKTAIWLVVGITLVTVLGGAIAAIAGFASFFNRVAEPTRAVTTAPTATDPTPKRAATPPAAPAFASIVLEFGSEGIGAGQFKDARSVAVDGQGRVYVGEYTGGRIQVFDSEGQFLTQWMTDTKPVLLGMAADRKGTVYVVHPGSIFRYDGQTGRLLGEVPKRAQNRFEYYTDVFVTLDGSLYTIGSRTDILRITPDGEIKVVVNVREKLEEVVSLTRVVVDGTGNIYALESKDNFILKFSPDGRFITRFGGRGNQPGQLGSPHNLALDGQGRVYVSDSGRAIQVFDSHGRYIDSFGGRDLFFGLAVNDGGEIYASKRNHYKIVKFALNAKK